MSGSMFQVFHKMTDRDNREEALSLYSGPRRTYEIFCLAAESPQSMQQILDAVPGDEAFIRSIVREWLKMIFLAPQPRAKPIS